MGKVKRVHTPPYPPPQAGEDREGAAVETVDEALDWLDHVPALAPARDV